MYSKMSLVSYALTHPHTSYSLSHTLSREFFLCHLLVPYNVIAVSLIAVSPLTSVLRTNSGHSQDPSGRVNLRNSLYYRSGSQSQCTHWLLMGRAGKSGSSSLLYWTSVHCIWDAVVSALMHRWTKYLRLAKK